MKRALPRDVDSDSVSVVGVHNVDQSVRTLVTVAPQRVDLVLASHVPQGETQVLVLNGLHVETIVGMVVTTSPSFSS